MQVDLEALEAEMARPDARSASSGMLRMMLPMETASARSRSEYERLAVEAPYLSALLSSRFV